jgi:hypothetical protein
MGKALAKLVAPASDRLICHGHTTLEEQFLDVAQAQLKAEVPAHGATDDFSWKTVTVIKGFWFLHRAILRDRPDNLTMPAGVMASASRGQIPFTVNRESVSRLARSLLLRQRIRPKVKESFT